MISKLRAPYLLYDHEKAELAYSLHDQEDWVTTSRVCGMAETVIVMDMGHNTRLFPACRKKTCHHQGCVAMSYA
jgi:hypothetical protein